MTAGFPHEYQVSLVREPDGRGTLTTEMASPITAGPPAQFGGRDDVWSPEHLLIAATSMCLLTTFEALARRTALPPVGYHCEASGTLDKTREGIVFTRILLAVTLDVAPEHEAQAREVLAAAKRHCIISKSIKAPVELTVMTTSRTVAASA